MNCKQLIRNFTFFLLVFGMFSCSEETNNHFSERVKVTIRDVGHQLLLANQDSTSIVKPIIALESLKYQLSFEEELSIQPDSLITIIQNSFEKADLPQYYLIEVKDCENLEVVYSYEMKLDVENGIIPCRGRELEAACYILTVQFTKDIPEVAPKESKLIYMIGLGVLLLFAFIFFQRRKKPIPEVKDLNYASIGRFKFYPEQNKLIKEATEISLSKKECELLALFVASPNQVIKRDELMKKVWEDNGVIVGRSLDTYISKLRKKLKDDESIKLSNVHGVGYKLEIKLQ